MTDVICKACGTKLGELSDFEVGDSVTCESCDSTFDFVENTNEMYDNPLMVNDPDSYESPETPGIAEIEGVTDGVVTYVREDGIRVKDPVEDFDGDLPDSLVGSDQ